MSNGLAPARLYYRTAQPANHPLELITEPCPSPKDSPTTTLPGASCASTSPLRIQAAGIHRLYAATRLYLYRWSFLNCLQLKCNYRDTICEHVCHIKVAAVRTYCNTTRSVVNRDDGHDSITGNIDDRYIAVRKMGNVESTPVPGDG